MNELSSVFFFMVATMFTTIMQRGLSLQVNVPSDFVRVNSVMESALVSRTDPPRLRKTLWKQNASR